VDEHIITAILTGDEAEALFTIEEFYRALAFANHLSGHLRAGTAVETAATATGATTKAAAITAATARTAKATATIAAKATTRAAATEVAIKSAATWSVAKPATTVEIAAKVIALAAPALAAATATIPIKTHTLINTQYSSGMFWPATTDEGARATSHEFCQ
jgi:hypothetical protein